MQSVSTWPCAHVCLGPLQRHNYIFIRLLTAVNLIVFKEHVAPLS